MQNGLDDVDSRIDVPFAVEIKTFSKSSSPGPENCQNLALLGRENFRSISPLILEVSEVNTPYSSSQPHINVIIDRQFGVGNFKHVVVSVVVLVTAFSRYHVYKLQFCRLSLLRSKGSK